MNTKVKSRAQYEDNIRVRLSSEIKKQIDKKARKEKVTVSEYVRNLIVLALNKK